MYNSDKELNEIINSDFLYLNIKDEKPIYRSQVGWFLLSSEFVANMGPINYGLLMSHFIPLRVTNLVEDIFLFVALSDFFDPITPREPEGPEWIPEYQLVFSPALPKEDDTKTKWTGLLRVYVERGKLPAEVTYQDVEKRYSVASLEEKKEHKTRSKIKQLFHKQQRRKNKMRQEIPWFYQNP